MYRRLPIEDQPKEERLFLINVRETAYSNGEYGEVFATIVRRAVRDHQDPDNEGRMIYADGANASGYRNTSWSNDYMVDQFAIRAQMNLPRSMNYKAEERCRIYGSAYSFRDVYEADLHFMSEGTKTLKKVMRDLQKYELEFGRIDYDSPAQMLIRVGKSLGIKKFLAVSRWGSGSSLDDASNFCEFLAPDVDGVIHSMADKLYKKYE